MPSEPFDPYSQNAMFSRILERIEQQDREAREFRTEIKESFSTFQQELKNSDTRVSALENAAWRQRGAVAAIALFISMMWEWLTKKI